MSSTIQYRPHGSTGPWTVLGQMPAGSDMQMIGPDATPPTPGGASPDGAKATDANTVLTDDTGAQWKLALGGAGQGMIVQWMPKGSAGFSPAGHSQNVTGIEKWKASCAQWVTPYPAGSTTTGWWMASVSGATVSWSQISGDPSVTPPAPGGTWLSVRGGKLVWPDGSTKVLKGINICGDAGGWPFLTLQQMVGNDPSGGIFRKAFPRGNYVRICCYSLNTTPESIAPQVNILTSLGVYCNVEFHLTGMSMPTNGAISTFYSRHATYFKPNGLVGFATINEPGFWTGANGGNPNGMRQMVHNVYDAIRNTGNGTIIQVMGFYSVIRDGFLTQADFNGLTNVIADMHHYPAESGLGPYSTYADNVTGINGKIAEFHTVHTADGLMPVVMSEGGDSNDGTNQDANWQSAVQAVIDKTNDGTLAGYTMWYPNGYDGGNDRLFTAPYDGSGFTPYGQMVHNDMA